MTAGEDENSVLEAEVMAKVVVATAKEVNKLVWRVMAEMESKLVGVMVEVESNSREGERRNKQKLGGSDTMINCRKKFV